MATLGEMAAGIAHELNQPLSAIATYARACERFLQSAEPDLPETLSSLQEIGLEAMRAADIIRRLRQLVGSRPAPHAPADLNDLLRDLAVLAEADARVHKTQIAFDLAANLPPINGDRAQLQQMVLTLVRNAIEALAEGSGTARRIVIRTVRAPDGRIELSVSDSGPGVAADMIDRLFIPYATSKPTGTGLGLVISQSIAQAHGGSIAYRVNEPSGACFFVRLAVAE
jgi:two-component system sensor kinase FixL